VTGSFQLLFLISGVFSALLDNAAVYISFAASAAARHNITIEQTTLDESGSTVGFLYVFFEQYPVEAFRLIRALSAGSVLMGGCTLIGNAPNIVVTFMATRYAYRVRSAAVDSSTNVPYRYVERVGFLRQMITATVVLAPIFLVVAFVML
jgi:Na+/H+ antiporter NhaD/arsenite permease-like protein